MSRADVFDGLGMVKTWNAVFVGEGMEKIK